MAEKHLLFSLEEENAKALGETIANKTSRKIVNFLAEEEASENKIAKSLKIPINTIEYNLKKLLNAGLIEKSKKFFWSEKGKKIGVYKVANKIIIISPKRSSFNKLKSFLPVILISAVFSAFIWLYNKTNFFVRPIKEIIEVQKETVVVGAEDFTTTSLSYFGILEYFLIGIWTVLIIFIIYTSMKGGKK